MHKALSLLSIAAKGGRVVSGETATLQAVRRGKADLVILSQDASRNTEKKFLNLCKYHDVPVIVFGEKAALGRAIGKGERSSLAVLDPSLAAEVRRRIEEEPEIGERSVL